ncbi:oocyte zinc finger protein XlCOF6-like isoform X23 [Ostrinia nubilalis]|uniref:oocyte zinc finger protein XlCOF6-like isoform X23 n=1 Tax=Ostrinia nubilalis TaxID=29057 RepID=UPI0030824640
MAAKTTDWRPGPTVCRCCLSEGCYKDISTEYFWMGKREVYSEMLSETFSLSIAYSTSGGPNSNSRLICEPCISRLRDASDFKRQVQECEKTFMQYLDPGTERLSDFETAESRIEVTLESLETEVKVEQVKTEKDESDGDDFGDRTDFPDLDDDDDDLDDQPLTRLATRVPKKESVDTEADSKPEKRKATTKAKTSPAKKAKTKKEVVKATTSKAAKPTEKKKKELDPMVNATNNAKIIVEYTTAYPFKLPKRGIVCLYCDKTFDGPTLFRRHMADQHPLVNISKAFAHIPYGYIKIDCTELRCRICSAELKQLSDAVNHLVDDHNLEIDFDYDLGVQPFILPGERWDCALCDSKFISLRALSSHTQIHFAKHHCDVCGRSYFYLNRLEKHKEDSHSELWSCLRCKSTFETLEDKKNHIQESPLCWEYICTLCGERFHTLALRNSHKTQVHELKSKPFPCSECPRVFTDRRVYKRHFTVNHTNQYFACECGKKFCSQFTLKEHMVVHTKEKSFVCTVCSKAFPRKNSLVAHLWVHSDQKRFECTDCDKQFKMKKTWKMHMKNYHPDVPMS